LNNLHTHFKFASTQKTVIKEALANGRIFKMKSSAIIKSCMVLDLLAKNIK
jgi:hypothetical protein